MLPEYCDLIILDIRNKEFIMVEAKDLQMIVELI